MALTNFEISCTMIDRRTIASPTGGFVTIWSDGAAFKAAIDTATSDEAKIAMQTTGREIYTIMVDKNVPLTRDSYFRNEKTGAYARVMNTGMEAPTISSLPVRQFQGEYIGMNREDLPK